MSHHVETVLRDALAGHADTIAEPDDAWAGFARREDRNRRSRRFRRIRTGVVFAAVLAVAAGVQSNLVPLPGWAPGIAIAAGPSELGRSPTRGSLAGDAAWLRDMRRQVTGIADPEGLWDVADRDEIRVLFAGDVPGHRLALVLVPLRLGLITDWTLIWFDGPPGAAAHQMRRGSNEGADTAVTSWLEGSTTGPGLAVVVGPAGSTVVMRHGAAYTPAGTVAYRDTVTSDRSGVAIAELPAAVHAPAADAVVTKDGRTLYDGPINGAWSGSSVEAEPTDEMLDTVSRGARGPALDRAALASFLRAAAANSRLPLRGLDIRLRWVGAVNGQPAALLTIHPPGSGVLAFAYHGVAMAYSTDLRLLLPAAGADRRPIGWRMRAEGKDDRTGEAVVIAPPGATSVTLTVDGGGPLPVGLDATGRGMVTVDPDRPATLTAYFAAGEPPIDSPIPMFESDSGGLPGTTPGTRVVA